MDTLSSVDTIEDGGTMEPKMWWLIHGAFYFRYSENRFQAIRIQDNHALLVAKEIRVLIPLFIQLEGIRCYHLK